MSAITTPLPTVSPRMVWLGGAVLVMGLAAIALLIWFGGPFLAFGTTRPLDSVTARAGFVVLTIVAVGTVVARRVWVRRKAIEGLSRGLLDDKAGDDSAILAERMKEALDTLKKAGKSRRSTLYDLPWYLLIGPPATGKTTALVNSGLNFPLARGVTPTTVEGIGGTRYCDWLFAEEAVLIDTAGRYTTQDSDQAVDRRSWLSFLDLLKRHRPKQPINGVLIAFSLPDLLTLDAATLNQHAEAIRARLIELHERLKVDFPVYALFTKADLVVGFNDYFGDLGEEARRQVWGATFQTAERKRNMVGDVPAEFDLLVERLNTGMSDRLQDEPVPSTRVALFGFPGQMAGLRKPVYDFLNKIFEPTRYQAKVTLRGFYFTSGAQHGTAVDRLLMALVKNFGAREVGSVSYSGVGKSYFLHDLLTKVVIGEAAWVSTDRGAVRRAFILRVCALAAIALVTLGCVGAWWTSYGENDALIAATAASTSDYDRAYGSLARQARVADHRFDQILPALDALRAMPALRPPPPWSAFGLSQSADLASSTDQSYAVALERMLRPRLLFRLEEFLDANAADPIAVYDALRVYMMLGNQHHPVDRALVLSWIANDLTRLLPGAGTQEEARKRVIGHVTAMLDNEPLQQPLVQPSALIQGDAQKLLRRLTVAQRAYALIRAQAGAAPQPDWVASERGGQDYDRVFDAIPGPQGREIRIPGFFTYAGFYRSLMAKLPGIAGQLKADDAWVLGSFDNPAAVASSYDTLDQDVLALYRVEFDKVWQTALARLQLRKLTADRPSYAALNALAAKTTSPLLALLTSIGEETALTRPRAGFDPNAPAAGAPASGGQPAPSLAPQAKAPGADIEADFAPYGALLAPVAAGSRPIDEVINALGGILANMPGTKDQADALLKQVSQLRVSAGRLPPPFAAMVQKAAAEFDNDVSSALRQQFVRAMADQVVEPCRTKLRGAYPFVTGGRDLSIDDFSRLFAPAPTGAFDTFFKQNLESIVDTRSALWTLRPDGAGARALPPSAIQTFQNAAAIRDVFFSPGQAAPSITFRVIPSPLNVSGITARLEINGTVIETKQNSPLSGGLVNWPGPTQDGGIAAINLLSDTAGEPPVGIDPKYGGWALFRLLDGARPIPSGLSRSFVLGTTELEYKFLNPKASEIFRLLRGFSCPVGP